MASRHQKKNTRTQRRGNLHHGVRKKGLLNYSSIRPCLHVEIECVHRICLLTDSVDRSCFGSGQVLWDRNPGFLKSEIGPFSDFKGKSYLMGLKSAHFQEYDFQESGVGDRFLKMGTHFQERSGSLENGLCVTWSGFWVCPGYLWLLILVAVEQIDDQITRRLVA